MFDLGFRVVAALGLISGLIYWVVYSWRDGEDWLRSIIKTMTLAPLAAFWLLTGTMAGTPDWPMATGLALGVFGDFLLSRPGGKAFLAGMAAFGLGHVAYAAGMLMRSGELGFAPVGGEQFWALCAIAVLVISTEVWLRPHTGALLWPVRIYVLVIALMAVAATVLPENPGRAELQLGAVLFLVSDLLLSIRLFVLRGGRSRALLGGLLWPAYVFGQLLLFWGAVLFWTFPKA